MLEKRLIDVLNAGLGLLKEGEKGFQAALEAVAKTFEELKTVGAADQSEAAQKIREVLDNTIRGVRDVSGKAEENFHRVLEEARKNYSQILEHARTVVGEERISDLNSRLEDLAKFVQEKAVNVKDVAGDKAARTGDAKGSAQSGTAEPHQ
jgi:vacuolar-type H+-ATPase subunit H